MAVITKRGFPPVAASIGSYAVPFSRPAGANGFVLDDAIGGGLKGTANRTQFEYLLQRPDNGDPGARFDWRSLRTVTPVEQAIRTLLPFMPPLTKPPVSSAGGRG